MDWHRLRGSDARHRIPELQQVILSPQFSYEALLDVFMAAPKSARGAGGRK